MPITLLEIARITVDGSDDAQPKADPQTEKIKQGLRLVDVAKFVFPEHETIAHLKKELSLMNDVLMTRIWFENCPLSVKYELKVFNKIMHQCNCKFCDRVAGVKDECQFWGFVLRLLVHLRMTYSFPSNTPGKLVRSTNPITGFWSAIYRPRQVARFATVNPQECVDFTPDPAFDGNKACKHMGGVSEIDVHIAFVENNNVYRFSYGRKLWDHKNIGSLETELRKLEVLRMQLRCVI
jgi:hypothetical protein